MSWIVLGELIVVALIGAAIGLSMLATLWIERITPPQGDFLDVDGVKIHVLVRGHGPPVVLIHGLAGQIGHFAHSLVARLEGDFQVVAFDRPGSGYSAPGPGGVREQAAIIAQAMRLLKLGKPLIVGHSLGGAVALALALDQPDCAGGLALIAPATHAAKKAPALFRSLAIRSTLLRRLYAWCAAGPAALVARPVFFRAAFAPERAPANFGAAGGGLLALRPRNIYVTSTELMGVLDDQKTIESLVSRYGSLKIPVGVLYGRDDHILDWRVQGESMKEEAPSLDFELVAGGHMLPVTQPDLCARFIRRIAARMKTR